MADFDFSTLVTDRAPADLSVLRGLLSTPMEDWTAEQLAAFNQAISKGAYNYTDLNRVTACMDYLNERLTAAGYVTGYQRIRIPHKGGSGLPEGYTELEYIESTGTQYISTGLSLSPNAKLSMIVSHYEWQMWTSFFGARVSSSSTSPLQFAFGSTANTNELRVDYFGDNSAFTAEDIEQLTEIVQDGNQFSGFDTTLTLNESIAEPIYQPLILFGLNNAGTISNLSKFRMYRCKIYDYGDLIGDYIPCENPSGEVGLYDTVTAEFYRNSGTGEFAAGPEVPETGPILDPYTWYEDDTPTATQMVRYLQNVSALRETLTLPEDTAQVPGNMAGLTQTEANNIESILNVIHQYLVAMQAVFLRAGMGWAVSGGPGYYFVNGG